jgi:hypothetical protein
MNFDPRLVQRLTRPLKRPGVTNHRMAEGLLERFQILGNRLPLLERQLSRWSSIAELDAGQVPIIYAQSSELDEREIADFQESIQKSQESTVVAKKERRSPVSIATATDSPSDVMPLVQQEISSSPIDSIETSVTPIKAVKAIASAPPSPKISDPSQSPISPISNSPSQRSSEPLRQPLSFTTNIPPEISEPQPLASQAKQINSVNTAQPSASQAKQINPVNTAQPEITLQTKQINPVNTAQPEIAFQVQEINPVNTTQSEIALPSTFQPASSQTLVIQPVSDGVIQARYDYADSAADVMPLVQQEISSSSINSVEPSVTPIKAIASPPPSPKISDLSPSPIAPITNSPSQRSSETLREPLSFATNIPPEISKPQPSASQAKQINPVNREQTEISFQVQEINPVNTTQPEIALPSTFQPASSQTLVIQPVSDGVIQARYDYADSASDVMPLVQQEISLSPINSVEPSVTPIKAIASPPPSPKISDPSPSSIAPISNSPSQRSLEPLREPLSFATNIIPPEISEPQPLAPQAKQINSVNTAQPSASQAKQINSVNTAQPEIALPSTFQPASSQTLVIQPVSDGVIQARYDYADSASDVMPLVQQEISLSPINSVEPSVTPIKAIASLPPSPQISDSSPSPIAPISNSPSQRSLEPLREPLSFATNIIPPEISKPQPSASQAKQINPVNTAQPEINFQNKQINPVNREQPEINLLANSQPEPSQTLVVQPVSDGVIQARYDNSAPSIVNAQPLISSVSDASTYPLAPLAPLGLEAIAPLENILNLDPPTSDPSIVKAFAVDNLPEVSEIPWASPENPQKTMPLVNADPIVASALSMPSVITNTESSTFESPTLIKVSQKVSQIDSQTNPISPKSLAPIITQDSSFGEQPNVKPAKAHISSLTQNLDNPTLENVTLTSAQTVYPSQDRLIFTQSNPTPVHENKIVSPPIPSEANNPKTKKSTDIAPSNDYQKQQNSSLSSNQVVKVKVFTDDFLPLPLPRESDRPPQSIWANNNSIKSSANKSAPNQPYILPTVQAIVEISEPTFEPLLLSRSNANALTSEMRRDSPNQSQPNSKVIANPSNMIGSQTSSSSTQTSIISPSSSSTITSRPNQDSNISTNISLNTSMRTQNISEVKEINEINIDLLVEKVERRIIKRLIVEGERRGKRQWL